MADHRVVAILGNSLGWSTALAVAGALDFDDAFRLVQGVALLQEEASAEGVSGGQLIYPRVDVDWQPVEAYEAAVEAALTNGSADGKSDDGADAKAYRSVDLGAYVVLAASDAGIARLLDLLPPVRVGERQFPLRLAFHGPYHTPLLTSVAEAATDRFSGLDWHAPEVTLIDGRGVRFTPWGTDPAALAAYTLGEQVVTPYGFATGVRVALREYAPDVFVLTGPGNTLGGVVGQLIVAEGYHDLRTRGDFEAIQVGPVPLVLSMSR
jgi:malonyl CoA-acyl carrier protein transacylase